MEQDECNVIIVMDQDMTLGLAKNVFGVMVEDISSAQCALELDMICVFVVGELVKLFAIIAMARA